MMKPKLILPLLWCLSAFAKAETEVGLLYRDALYAEEISRDADGAATRYAEILNRYDSQKQFAAAALFRLAEIRGKQGRKDEAISLYQRVLKEFPGMEAQAAPAREALTALGAAIPEANAMVEDPEDKEIARIRNLEKTSPDIAASGSLLAVAARADQLRVVTYLLGRGADPNVMGEGVYGSMTPLSMAAINGNLAMCELLLKSGANVAGMGDYRPMDMAIDSCRVKIVELFLKSGVDVNKPNAKGQIWLLNAIARGYQPTVNLLLDSKADVNLTVPTENISALHMAVFFENTKLVERLIRTGANPSLPCKVTWKSYSMPYSTAPFAVEIGDTPLMVAVGRNNPKLMELLAAKTTDADLPSLLARAVDLNAPAAAAWLLGKGVSANATTPEGMPLIIRASKRWSPEMLKLLLQHGADPNAMFQGRMVPDKVPASHASSYRIGTYSALRIAAGADINMTSPNAPMMEMFEVLVKGGAKPDDEWLKGLAGEPTATETPRGSTPEMRQAIVRQFLIPLLAEKPAVILVAPSSFKQHSVLQTKGASAPMDLAQLLLTPESPLELPLLQQGIGSYIAPLAFVIWRKSGDGQIKEAALGTLDQESALPHLQWGDVVELSHTTPPAEYSGISYSNKFPDENIWQLQRRISFPITIGTEGAMVSYQVRGDLLAFDPTKNELPWGELRKIAQLLKEPSARWERALISRKGWSDIDLDLSGIRIRVSTTPAGPLEPLKPFFLQPGDSVKLIPQKKSGAELETEKDAMKQRRSMVRIEAPGLLAKKTHGIESNRGTIPAPTLVEALADLLSSREAVPIGTPPEEILLRLGKYDYFKEPVVIWNHPDFSKLQIRRLNPDDSEQVIKVDLASIIASTNESDSPEQVRSKDIQLQGGDILEVPLKGDAGGNWTGLSAAEASFFAKILNCQIQLWSPSEEVKLKDIRYLPLVFETLGGGKYPFLQAASAGTVSTTRIYDVLKSDGKAAGKLVRNQTTYLDAESVMRFVRDGDQITWAPIQYSAPKNPEDLPKGPASRPPSPGSDAGNPENK